MDKIELEAKNDHELLVMSVMQGNEMVDHLGRINGRLDDHEGRLRCLEVAEPKTSKLSTKQKAGAWAGLVTFFAAVIAAVAEYLNKH